MNLDRVETLMKELLIELGEDPAREGLLNTPKRTAKSWEFLTKGYRESLDEVVNGAIFTSEANNMVIVKDIEVYSLCEHHMLPFYGTCHVGYISRDKVLGVSKIARIADMYARRLQIQENLTAQIARAIMDTVDPVGVGVVMECKHMCMMMRGVEKQNSLMTTSSMLGAFRKNRATREEFLQLIKER
ncbi:MAG: GTP cyclohydrolase I FolE [Spirochaetales bacterium]|nr:GTP cyclohydrolase I FolE [Spirochaetales bacterium]